MSFASRRRTSCFRVAYDFLEPRQLLAGDVSVSVFGDDLVIRGDDQANQISISQTEDGLAITGQQTTINGLSSAFQVFTSLDNMRLRMRGGDDRVDVNGISISGRLDVDLDHGNDRLMLDDVVAEDAFLGGGTDDNVLEIGTLEVHRRIEISGRSGADFIAARYLFAGRSITVRTAGGNDTISFNVVNVPGNDLGVFSGSGDDTVMISGETIAEDVRMILGAGNDWLAMLPERNGTTAAIDSRLSVIAGGGSDSVVLDAGVEVGARALLIGGGGRGDQLDDDSVHAGRDIAFESNAVDDTNQRVHQIYDQLAENEIDDVAFGATALRLDPATQYVTAVDRSPTASVLWDRAVQQAVIETRVGPTIASRAYGMVHTAIFDAWSAYDRTAVSTQLDDTLQRPDSENTDTAKREAISYAAYRVLLDLFPSQKSSLDLLMNELGYDPNRETDDVSTPAGIGIRMAEALLQARHQDGSNQLGDDPDGTAGEAYSSTVNYQPVNTPENIVAPDRWTPEFVPIDAEPEDVLRVQSFLTPHWGDVERFGVAPIESLRPAAPEPFLLTEAQLDWEAGTIQPVGGEVMPISSDLVGTLINPAFIAQAQEVVDFSANLTDEQKLIAEFWEDAGGTSFPPGTWMTFGEFTSARDDHSIDQDVQMFFALGNAVMDAGIATWEAKRFYDYARPVRVIRELGRWGLIGEFDEDLGGFAIDAWVEGSGTRRILATDFLTYQTPGSDPSPPFAEFTSGHSAFSSAGAEVLRRFTGSDDFGASVTFASGESRFEPGVTPTVPTTLSWSTFTAAADEAGISRLYGGIHFDAGNELGKTLGRAAGQLAWERAQQFISGNA